MWDLPRPGLEPVSPALAGRLSTTAPPGKPPDFLQHTNGNKGHPQVTGMVPKAWLKGHAGGCEGLLSPASSAALSLPTLHLTGTSEISGKYAETKLL